MMLSQSMNPYAPPPHFQPLSSPPDLDPGIHHHQMSAAPQKPKTRHHHHPYGLHSESGSRGHQSDSSTPGPIRRRISRACDQCNQLRTRCDGKQPCQHCVDFALKCEYQRERKKRGKASRKDLQAAAAAAAAQNGGVPPNGSTSPESSVGGGRRASDLPPPPRPAGLRRRESSSAVSARGSIGDLHDLSQQQQQQIHHSHLGPQQHPHHQHPHHQLPPPDSPSLHMPHEGVPPNMPMHFDRMSPFHQQHSPSIPPGAGPANAYSQNEFMMSPHHQAPPMQFPGSAANSISGLIAGHSPEEASPSWMSLPSPPQQQTFNAGIRYPVLLPLLPHLTSIIPPGLACDLLDLYFMNPSTSFFQPASPYVLTQIFRRRSFLHPTTPRPTSPALLCAMLWVAAQTCDAPFLTATPTSRGRVCQKLLELCISLLRPLVHVSFTAPQPMRASADSESSGIGLGLGGLGGGHSGSPAGREGVVGAAGTLDDVLTYAHLGIVISASEFKAASLRWWHTAWTLARELKLNREVDTMVEHLDDELDHHSPSGSAAGNVSAHPTGPTGLSEEEREERRRTWWLLYIVDRHLALCYNRPIALLDVECEGLYLPLDDVVWQNGDFYGSNEQTMYSQQPVSPTGALPPHMTRTPGPIFEISGCGLYQFFLPLMAILGQVVDLHHARNRPKFGAMGLQSNTEGSAGAGDGLEPLVEQITAELNTYARSLQQFEEANIRSRSTDGAKGDAERRGEGQLSDMEIQAKIAISYGTHVMHVLHILVCGKWDPISMLDDNDLWISSSSFISTTAHAVSAAEAIGNILKYDPDLSFMPYFFGIYLLQGSFLLLLIADKLQGEASEAVVNACETIVRAHEVCVVTLNTEYQRNFRKVMRSALNQVRGRGNPEDIDEQKHRRREVLQLYRWCGNGTGLAL